MKHLTLIAVALLASSAWSQVYVNPYMRNDGTYVPGHVRSAPDFTPLNNYGTQGNVNPYTGQAGTVNPYAQPQLPQPPRGSMYRPPSGGMYDSPQPRRY